MHCAPTRRRTAALGRQEKFKLLLPGLSIPFTRDPVNVAAHLVREPASAREPPAERLDEPIIALPSLCVRRWSQSSRGQLPFPRRYRLRHPALTGRADRPARLSGTTAHPLDIAQSRRVESPLRLRGEITTPLHCKYARQRLYPGVADESFVSPRVLRVDSSPTALPRRVLQGGQAAHDQSLLLRANYCHSDGLHPRPAQGGA